LSTKNGGIWSDDLHVKEICALQFHFFEHPKVLLCAFAQKHTRLFDFQKQNKVRVWTTDEILKKFNENNNS